MKYSLQPTGDSYGTLPLPFVINNRGMVENQDFWRGTPYKLLGLSSVPTPGVMDVAIFITHDELVPEDMYLAIDNYAVFTDNANHWYTTEHKIESVEEVE